MLRLPKLAAAIAITVAISLYGCQNLGLNTDLKKQEQITAAYRRYAREFPQVKEISAAQLQQLQQQEKEIVLIDVRSPEEIAVSHIPGAITAAEFVSSLKLNPEQYRDKMIVAYCTIGYRSGLYAQKLQDEMEISNLSGGLLAWSHTAGKLLNARGNSTHKVHVFGRQWQLTSKAYEPVW